MISETHPHRTAAEVLQVFIARCRRLAQTPAAVHWAAPQVHGFRPGTIAGKRRRSFAFAAIRDDPRFQAVVEKMGLPRTSKNLSSVCAAYAK